MIYTQQQLPWRGNREIWPSIEQNMSMETLTRVDECMTKASNGSQRGQIGGGDGSGSCVREGTRGNSSSQKLRPLLPSTPGGPSKRPPSPTGPRFKKPKRVAVPAACQNCRKRKVKCDAIRPVCASCATSNVKCEYLVPEGLSQRDAERQKLQQMGAVSKANQDLRAILDLLRRERGQEAHILQQIQNAPSLDDAAAVIINMAGTVDYGSHENQQIFIEPSIQSQARLSNSPAHEIDWQPAEINLARWTAIADDNALLTHLLSLFWTWDNTVSPIIDRCMFLEDLRSADPSEFGTPPPGARRLFCAPFLVNCVLAVACLYSTNPSVYSVPGDNTSRGRSFAEESKRLLPDEPLSLTRMQGIGLLWLWESCAGDIHMTDQYLEEYFKDYKSLHLDSIEVPSDFDDWNSRQGRELQALSHIIWGVYFTHIKMAITFQVQFRTSRPRIRQLFADSAIPHLSNTDVAHWWPHPVNDPRSLRPLHYRELLVARCNLSVVIEEANSLLSNGRFKGDPTSMEIARSKSEACYTRLVQWKADLPEYLKAEHSTLPVVLLLHTLYDSALIELLNPLMEHYYDDTTFARSTPKQLRLAANFSLIHHVCIYRTLYTAKYEYSILQACLKAATTALYDLNDGGTDIFLRACQGLYEAGEFLKLANTFLAVTKGLIMTNSLDLPPEAAIVEEKFYPALNNRPFTPFKEDGRLLMYWPKRVVDHEFSTLIERTQLLSLQRNPSQ